MSNTLEQKTEMLLKGVLTHFPEARPIDLQKNTPLGAKIREACFRSGCAISGKTKDIEWKRAGLALRNHLVIRSKPAPCFDHK